MKRILLVLLLILCFSSASFAQEEQVWVTMGEDVFDQLTFTPGVFSRAMGPKVFAADHGAVVTRLPVRDLNAVSVFIHSVSNRCPGFIVHNTYEEATATLAIAESGTYKALATPFNIDQQTLVNQLLPLLDKTNILNTISHLSTTYNNRYYQNASGEQSALWIRDLWQGYAAGRSDVTVTTYAHSGYVQPSVILTIQGTSLASEVVVLGGHLDSIKSGATNTNPGTIAPGADDNASGIAVLSEVIRVLLANGFTPDRTVKFMGYAAEEVGLRGSGDIAQDHVDAGTNVVGVLQLDMTGFNGSAEDIVMMDDFTNADLNAFVGDLIDEYQPTLQWTYSTCGYGCSDHASWHNRGYPATIPFEARFGDHNQQIHTSNDTLATLGNQTDHALKFAKVALPFAIETSVAGCTPAAVADAGADQSINEGNSVQIGTAAQAGTTYSWSPGGATTAQITVSPTATTTYTVTATTSCGSVQDSVTVTVLPAGQNGPQNAAYNSSLGAPSCAVAGSSCDSTTLLEGRGTVGPEPNQPNTLGTCTDGSSGSYQSDESNERIVVSTLDGTDMTVGATVRIDTTVWAWQTGSNDTLDLYYAADANNPTWVFIASLSPSAGGSQTLSTTYTLPTGALQAVRANFRYNGSQSTCSTGNYDDTDDLVFAVETVAACSVDADCDNGLYCDGTETCNAGTCQSGSAVTCDDGVSCTVDSCNEATDSCDATPNNGLCDNGLFCDGAETCNATLGCQAGAAPNCNDGVSCTVDSCNEGTDSCDNAPNNGACDNGLFCDGAEVCNATLGCQDSADPCSGSQTCNETTDACEGTGGCLHDVDFEAGAGGWTVGADTCSTGSFVVGSPDATAWQVGGGNPGSAFYTRPNAGGIGADDVDGGTCEALSPTVNAGAEAAVQVSLDYFHGQRDAGDDAGDGFTIEVLNNGSVVGTLVSIGDVTNNAAWTNVSTTVSNPGNIQLRVRATDATGGGDIIEGGIDNVQICPTTPPPACTVEENFTGGLGAWTTSGTCSTGTFVAATPTQQTSTVVTQVGGDHTTGTGNAAFTATNTSAGANDVDGGTCILTSPSFNVAAASDLSIWYFHGQRDAGDDAGDFFLLEVSTNGGSSYSPLVSIGDVQTVAGWTQATTTIPAGADVRLRVQVADGTSGGDIVEGGIDDLSICPSN